ncbi:MAG: divergent polysaccharide deacetylase family protein, partial [Candidatus Hydrogenedentota bacterium]
MGRLLMEHTETGPDTEASQRAESRDLRPWIRLLTGFALTFAGALGAFVFTSLYLESRPLDLREEADALHADLQQTLVEAGVPPENIEGSETEDLARDNVLWRYAEFDVDLPQRLNLDGLARVVVRNMTLRDVAVLPEEEAETMRSYRLAYGGRDIAEVRLHAPPPPPEPEPAYSRLGEDLAAALVEWLETSEVPLSAVEQLAPESADSETDPCERRRVVAELAEPADLDQLEPQLDELELPFEDNIFEREALTEPLHAYHRAYVWRADDCPWVELHILPDAEMAESEGLERPTPASLEQREDGELDLEEEDPAEAGDEPPRMSVIVDDGGYGGERTERILAVDAPLTLAILPSTPGGSEVAERARDKGFEVMLHMPMQAGDENVTYPGEIRTDMEAEEIAELTKRALGEISGAAGVNNHTGSAFTEDADAMEAFLEVLREEELY